jgi:putative heme-binding domain-containing protein
MNVQCSFQTFIILSLLLAPRPPMSTGPHAPRPITAWPTNPLEVRIAFDHPLDPASIAALAGQSIPFGRQAAPRGTLKIIAAQLANKDRTLVLSTDPHPWDATYTLALDGLRAADPDASPVAVNLDYNLTGVEVIHESEDGETLETVWWPHLDPEVVRSSTAGSADHERSLARLRQTGRLTIRTLLTLPADTTTLALDATEPLTIEEASLDGEPATLDDQSRHASLECEASGEPAELFLVLKTAESVQSASPSLRASLKVDTDLEPHPLRIDQTRVPWAPAPPPAPNEPPPFPESLTGGDPARGETVFFGAESKCATCHVFRGRGEHVGPDLTSSHEKKPAVLLRDIAEPSAEIHPDYVPYTIVVKDGRVLAGLVRIDPDGALRVTDTSAQQTRIPRNELEELRPTATSIMPVGLAGALGEQQLKDLLAYLTQSPIE